MNKIILIGNVGKDPEIFRTTENLPISKFSLATTKKRKGEDQTSWHNIITFGKLSEIVEKFVNKGSKIALEGEIEYRSWENEGKKYYKTEIIAYNIELLSPKSETSSQVVQEKAILSPKIDLDSIDDELPF